MKFTPLAIPEVILIEPDIFGDDRGFFMETWNAKNFEKAGIPVSFVQDNHSKSAKGILRGLHYQVQQTQGKLVRVTAGAVFDVAVDIDPESMLGTTIVVQGMSHNAMPTLRSLGLNLTLNF